MKSDIDFTELECCIKRINEIIDLRNIMEELSRVTQLKADIPDIFKEISDINILVGIPKA